MGGAHGVHGQAMSVGDRPPRSIVAESLPKALRSAPIDEVGEAEP
jgi:hypothetical protein